MTKITTWVAFGVAAATLTLALPATSEAGHYHHHSHWHWGGYHHHYYRYGYAPSYYYGYYGYPVPALGYYYGQPAPADDTVAARIHVIVPADARVWVAGQETTQTGRDRVFESPELSPGRVYSYAIKAQWRGDDGKEITQTRNVDVQANTNVDVDFTVPAL